MDVPTFTTAASLPPDGKEIRKTGSTGSRKPAKTMNDVELPHTHSTNKSAGTDKENPSRSKPVQPAAESLEAGNQTVRPSDFKKTTERQPYVPPPPVPDPVVRPTKSPPKALIAVGVGVAILASLAGFSFLANASKKSQVQTHVEKSEFAEAVEVINGASTLMLPSRDELRTKVEKEWLTYLEEKEKDLTKSGTWLAWKEFLDRPNGFEKKTPAHDKIRQNAITQLSSTAIKGVDSQVGKDIDAARDIVARTRTLLPAEVVARLEARIADKQNAADILDARNYLERRDFEACLKKLDAKAAFDKDDAAERDTLHTDAAKGAAERDQTDKKNVAALDAAKSKAVAQSKYDDAIKFRRIPEAHVGSHQRGTPQAAGAGHERSGGEVVGCSAGRQSQSGRLPGIAEKPQGPTREPRSGRRESVRHADPGPYRQRK